MDENPYQTPQVSAGDAEPLWKAVLLRGLPNVVFWGGVTGALMFLVTDRPLTSIHAAMAAASAVGISWWWLERPRR